MSGALTIHARFDGLRELRDRLDRLDPHHELGITVDQVGGDAERCLRLVAPKRTGNLADHVTYSGTGDLTGEVTSTARNPTSGYAYTAVTRFGHGEIRPNADRAAASIVATGAARAPHSGHPPALRFVIGGRVVYAQKVRAWKPAGGDWVRKADEPIRAAAGSRMGELRDRLIRQVTGRP